MPEIQHHVGIQAPIERVHAHFATLEGLADFWTTTVEGDPAPGGTLRFYFGGPDAAAVMDVLEVTANRVVWRCVDGPEEWIGTEFTFDLSVGDDETVVYFTNTGWREVKEFMGHCTTKWGYFLLGLKSTLEGAAPVSYPNDRAIISWESSSRAARLPSA
ncbi:MAG: Aha1 domain protein [Actinomycetia bacterium]|nr:Aha1 domain protein [Actinomycetes bacterium]